MTSNNDSNGKKQPFGRVSEERPLDALLPEMTRPSARGGSGEVDARPVHPRVLEVELEHHLEWALACWFDPGADALEEQLSRLVEVTMLSEFSQPPTEELAERNFEAIQLLVFDQLSQASRAAVEAVGFDEADYVADEYVERMSAWREEAEAAGLDVPGSPASVWAAAIERPNASIADKLDAIQEQMVDQLDGEVWGATPGGPSRLMATYFRQHFNTTVTPNRDGLHNFELFLVQDRPDALRWMPPVLFQALCDFVGVILQAEHGLSVQWGLCEPDESGFAPPPVFRVMQAGEPRYIPVGEHVAKWCLMPQQDDAPTLAERVAELAKSSG